MTILAREPIQNGNELVTISTPVQGGNMITQLIENGGVAAQLSSVFTPTAVAGLQRFLHLTDAKSDTGIPIAVAPGAGVVGISRIAGTSMYLVGETTSASAVTDKAFFEFTLPESYVAGSNIPVTVNAVVLGTGTLNTAATTMTVAAYTETNGVEAALTVSAAQLIPATTAADLSFTITGTNLVPGQHVAIELSMLVTSTAGANTGHLQSVSYQA